MCVLVGCSAKSICNFALRPQEFIQPMEKTRKMVEARYPGINAWYDSLRFACVFRDTLISGEGGSRIHAVFAAKEKPEGAVLLIHGYGVNHIAMMHMARVYRDSLGFNVILPDLQYHGMSGGNAVQMGWHDRLDARRWLDVAYNLWHDDFMIVHGVSMGAATTMMLSGEPDLPEYVRGFVEDCGYTSVWDEFSYLRRRFLVSEKLLRKSSDCCERMYGWNFFQASSVDALARCDRPMLFIHGKEDNFVPSDFAGKCYDAKVSGYKELWVVPDTPEHALAYHDHPDEYTARLRSFIKRIKESL